jgi:hypothetical protein
MAGAQGLLEWSSGPEETKSQQKKKKKATTNRLLGK